MKMLPMLERQELKKKQTQSYGKSAAASGSSHCGEQVNSRRKCQPSSGGRSIAEDHYCQGDRSSLGGGGGGE